VKTSKKKLSSFTRWTKFIVSKGKTVIPANPIHISLYLTHLSNSGRCSFHVVSCALYSIKWAHSILGHKDPIERPFVRHFKRHNKPRVVKKEIVTTSALVSLCDLYACSNNLLDVCDLCMILLTFAGFLRFDELSSLRCSNATFMDGYVELINKSNTDQNEILIVLGVTSAFPVSML
jgi:site-specific recombinase XerC